MVEARVGQGTFVGAPRLQQQLSTLTGFTEEMEKQGRSASSSVEEAAARAADAETAQALELPAGAMVWRIARVRLADGEPVALETTEVVASMVPGLLERADFGRTSLCETLRCHYGLGPVVAEQTLAAASADASVALPLGIAVGAPVLSLARAADTEGRAFEHMRSVYRGDAFVMKVRLDLKEA
jgi:GntR family transcriptional regulator